MVRFNVQSVKKETIKIGMGTHTVTVAYLEPTKTEVVRLNVSDVHLAPTQRVMVRLSVQSVQQEPIKIEKTTQNA